MSSPGGRTTAAPTGGGASVLIVPGWRGSGPEHWQSHWASTLPDARRVEQDDWVNPLRRAWVERLADTIEAASQEVFVVAHSLGCMATVQLPACALARVRGALLVAPADPERRPQLTDFAPVPRARLPFPSIVVASDDDPYCPVPRSREFASAWGSEFVLLPQAGHINVASGHRRWIEGQALLARLGAPLPARRGLALAA